MARPREFEMQTVLDRAMQVFWAKGYESASLDDLCKATGLGRSSLYAAFGDKHALYLTTLRHYEDQAVERITVALSGPHSIREALALLLGRMIDDIVAGPGRRGCFIGNCAGELARNDANASARVRRALDRLESVFRDALGRAQARGEIAASADLHALARFLTASFQGLRLVGKARPDRAVLDDIAAVMLRCLAE